MGGVLSSGDALNTKFDENINGINANISIDGGAKSSRNGGVQSPKANVAATPTFSPTASNALGKFPYANITGKPSGKKVNVCTLFTPGGNGIDVVVLVDSIRAISERFANTAYGFFLGKRVAFPIVANYVRNTWGKYGLIRSMFSSSTGLFSFQFSSIDRLDAMFENGPWFIRNNPLILKKWHPDENLLKKDVSTVSVWVKLNFVLVMAFNENGLSAIATKLGTPLMLDSYTSDMYIQSWGRESHYTCNVRVEYEWKPPRCSSCKVFGHIHEECLKNTCAGEKKIMKKPSQTSRGVLVGPKMGFKPQKEYRPGMLFILIESVSPDINTAYPLHTIRRIDCLDVISPLVFMHFKNIIVSSVNTEVFMHHDTTYLNRRNPVF
ncbi:putative reverse transcriptase domain-containing protein [Tanacetum coccineum]